MPPELELIAFIEAAIERVAKPLREEATALKAENQQLREANAALLRENAELRARLKTDSSNSNKPPSTDSPFKRPQPNKREKGKRKAGGQPGHKGVTRAVIPPEKVNHRIEVRPSACACGTRLDGVSVEGRPQVRQVVELPPISPEVTEYTFQFVRCPCCRELNAAPVPPEAVTCTGPRLSALAATLVGQYHLSRDAAAQLLQTVLGVPICAATVQDCCTQMSDALESPTREVEEALPAAPAAHLDETSWRQSGIMHWLWIAVTARFTCFAVNRRRGKDQLLRWFPKGFGGVIHCDRWRPYEMFARRQLCWSHLERDLQAIVDRNAAGGTSAVKALAGADAMFRTWHQFKEGAITRAALREGTAAYREQFRDFCSRGRAQDADRKWRSLGTDLLRQWDAVFRFIDSEGLEPTNNTAERDLRGAVMWRRTTQGTRTEEGSLFVSRILTANGTCKIQKRGVLEYLRDALLAHRRGSLAPSLLSQAAAPVQTG
ncbi:MAG: Mobile element protein [Microbacteriaceae bacterium]|nr:Mobile element protein [Microbacteriaceae bacterium]